MILFSKISEIQAIDANFTIYLREEYQIHDEQGFDRRSAHAAQIVDLLWMDERAIEYRQHENVEQRNELEIADMFTTDLINQCVI